MEMKWQIEITVKQLYSLDDDGKQNQCCIMRQTTVRVDNTFLSLSLSLNTLSLSKIEWLQLLGR